MKPIIADRIAVPAAGARALSAPWALAALSLSMLLSALGISIANIGLPDLARAFGASFQEVQWVVLAYLLAVTVLVVGAGRLGDRIGRRRLLLGGLLLFTAGSALCAAAPTLEFLVAARAAQGMGGAAMMALTLAFVGEIVPKARTGRAMGLLATMSAIGTALGPSLGGALLSGFGWRALFLAAVPPGLLAVALVARHLPADRPRETTEEARFDVTGTLLLAATLAAYALAMTLGRGQFGAANAALLLAAAIGAGVFVRAQTRSRAPLIRPAMLRDPVLGASLAASALVATVMMATLVVGPFHLARGLGLDAAAAGLALAAGPVVVALSGVPAGRLSDRFGAQRMTLAGLGAMAAGAALLAALPAPLPGFWGIALYLGPIAALTAGYALFQTANTAGVMAEVPQDRRGVTSGLLTLSRNLGLVTGASAMGAVFALGSAAGDIATAPPEAVAAGMRVSFAVAVLLVLAALGLMLRAGRAAPGH